MTLVRFRIGTSISEADGREMSPIGIDIIGHGDRLLAQDQFRALRR